ncbi:hypothetical protein SpCBS45565_g05301 [Spizellomyces sp. 'palustris']|nr:hypothetical protein SpCBS45565_g05301 [Spizellomyces sp. 'palustris']
MDTDRVLPLPIPSNPLAPTVDVAAAQLYFKRMPNGDLVNLDGPSVLYAAGLYLDRNEHAPAEAAEPSALTGSPPQVVSPDQLQNSLSASASFKLGPDSEGSDIADHTLDNTLDHHHHHLDVQHDPVAAAAAAAAAIAVQTPGTAKRGTGRRRSKPYDTLEGESPLNGRPSKSASAMARLAEGATKAMEELEDELALKRRRNTEAARRSRERKAVRLSTLENQVAQLEALNSSMSLKLAVVEKERAIFAAREAELNRRIASLEASLREAHDALMARAIGRQELPGAPADGADPLGPAPPSEGFAGEELLQAKMG